jgi:hypothetical protein
MSFVSKKRDVKKSQNSTTVLPTLEDRGWAGPRPRRVRYNDTIAAASLWRHGGIPSGRIDQFCRIVVCRLGRFCGMNGRECGIKLLPGPSQLTGRTNAYCQPFQLRSAVSKFIFGISSGITPETGPTGLKHLKGG